MAHRDPDDRSQRVSSTAMGDQYYGLVAEGYDSYLADVDFGDAPLYRRLLREQGGRALELACGTGRLLIPLCQDGLVVEGLDASIEMLVLCRRKADVLGLTVQLHHGAMEAFALPGRYNTIYCAVGSLSLLTTSEAQLAVMKACWAHLERRGFLALSMDRPRPGRHRADDVPHIRRQATRAGDGAIVRVWEQALTSAIPDVARSRLTYEIVVEDRVARRETQENLLRPAAPEDLSSMLDAAGFEDISLWNSTGTRPIAREDESYVALARRS